MADLSHKAVVAAFEKRYDYQSARNVLNLALAAGGLGAKDAYSAADVGKLADGLKSLGEREADVVVEALAGGDAAGAAPAKAEAKAEAKADKKEEKPAAKKPAAKKK